MMKKFTFFFLMLSAIAGAQTIAITPFASGLSGAVEITHAGDTRLFVVQQSGAIRIINPNGTVNPTPFLTLPNTVISSGGERGLLGLAFHPNYATNGYFYVNYTRAGDGDTVIARYQVSSDPNVANAASGTTLLIVDQPFSNHNGGTLKFGPDGYLYIGMGDGGSGGDPGNRAQNINENLGKMLRIDVNGSAPYGIPADNPYVGIAGNDEIWAVGLRNPWKFSFDRLTGELWMGDVGQNQVEEINKAAAGAAGLNYGWKCYEGNSVYSSCTGNTSTFTFPVAQYTHSATGGCSITGGYVYRGTMYPAFTGKYFFADYCLNRIGTVDNSNSISYTPTFSGNNNFTTFGEDLSGELYVASSGGNVYKIIDSSLSAADFAQQKITMYPNPATSVLNIQTNGSADLKLIEVFDLSGKSLLRKNLSSAETISVDVSSLRQGIYLMKLTTASGSELQSKLTIK